MPDIVITPNRGSSTNNPKIDFTGITAGTIKLEVLSDGTITWNGASGSLFSITDSLLGSLMSVNDISGLPLLEVFSDNRVIVGQFGARLGIGTVNPSSSAKLHIAGLNTAPPNVFLQTTNSAANGGIFWRNNTNTTTSAIASNYNISDSSGNIEFLTGGTTTRMSITSGGLVKMTDTTDVTGADTGALQVKGGIYVEKGGRFNNISLTTALSVTSGGTGLNSAAIGDIFYGSAANTLSALAGNTTATKRFLTQTGTGSASAAPAWGSIVDGDIPAALTGKTYNALTLTALATGFSIAGGTASKTLTVSNTLTLSGTDSSTLNIGSGGTLGTAAFTASTAYTSSVIVPNTTPSAGQILVGNAGGTAYAPVSVSGDITITSAGVTAIGASKVTNAMLVNSSITFGSTAQALGSTISAINGVSIGASTASTGNFTTVTAAAYDLSGTTSSSQGSGAAIQRVFSKSVSAGQLYKLCEYLDTEGDVAFEVQVSSETSGHSGTSTYRFQGAYQQLTGSYYRLYPFDDGLGHGDGPDTGLNANAWKLYIYGTTVSGSDYRYGIAIHVPSDRTGKTLVVTVTELKRGMTYTDQSTSSPITTFTETGNIYSHNNLLVSGNIIAGRYRGINSLVLNNFATVNPASNVFIYSQPNDRDSWIYLDSADTSSNWGIYHRQIDSAVGGLPANSIGFVGGGSNALQAYISLANGNAYFAGTVFASSFSGPATYVANLITFNNGGSGDASPTTYNGSAARTISYNTLGAAPTAGPTFTGRVTIPAASSTAGLKITSGFITSPTSSDSGVVEYDGGVMNFINSVGQRRRLFSEGSSIDGSNIGDTTPGSGTFNSFATTASSNAVFNGNIIAKANINLNGAVAAVVTMPGGSASKVPIFLTSGTLATTAVAHGVEWDGTNLFITNSSAARKTVAYTDSNITGTASNITGTYGGTLTSSQITTALSYTPAPVYRGTASISNATYTCAFTVTGSHLASAIRFTVQGTADSVVVNSIIDLTVNHSQDIIIKSISGIYTLLTVRVISNNDDAFAVLLTTNSPNAAVLRIEVFPLNSESITFTSTNPYTGSTLTHDCNPGIAVSATGGNNGDIRASGSFISTVGTGTAPLTVSSTTQVTNLNSQYLNGYSSDTANTANAIVRRDGSGNFSVGTITAASLIAGSVGTAIGSAPVVINGTIGNNDSHLTIKKPSQSVLSFLAWDGGNYIASNAHYENGTWTHSAPSGNTNSQLLNFVPGTGVKWWTSSNSTASWNVSNDLVLWNDSGVWQRSLSNTLTLGTSGTGLSGSTTYNNSGAATFTVTSNATSANTASTIVARDGSGNFSAGTVTVSTLSATDIPNVRRVRNGVYNNLGNPTVEEQAIIHGEFNNKFRFWSPTLQEESTNGTTWTTSTRASAQQLANMMIGEGQGTSFSAIPNPGVGNAGYYRLTWDSTASGSPAYCFLDAFYCYNSTNGNNVTFTVEAQDSGTSNWVSIATGTISNWPGHTYIPHSSLPYVDNATAGYYKKVRITFAITSAANINAFTLYGIEWWGGYPAGRRNVEYFDSSKNVYWPAVVYGTRFVSTVATGASPFIVSSTTEVINLNSQYLNGYSSDTANTANAIVRRDGTGNFSAGLISSTGLNSSGLISSTGLNSSGPVGIGTATPQSRLDVFSGSSDIMAASIGYNCGTNTFAGFSFGYQESGNGNYRKSALVFQRTDGHGQGANASGKIHLLLRNDGANSATSLTDSVVTIDSDASGTRSSVRFGIGTTTPSKRLEVVGGDALINVITVGKGSGNKTTNTAVGASALFSNTSSAIYGNYNSAFGYQALKYNTSGSYNTAIGWNALLANEDSGANTAIGGSALANITVGSLGGNIGIGTDSGWTIDTGSNNIVIGNSTTGITSGNNNVIIGHGISSLTGSLSNNIIIADGSGNRRINVDSSGNVSINANTATAGIKLDVTGNIGIQLENSLRLYSSTNYSRIYASSITGLTIAGRFSGSMYNLVITAGPSSYGVLYAQTDGTVNISPDGYDTLCSGSLKASDIQALNGSVSDQYGDLRVLPENAKTAAYTLATTDTGRLITITTGGITVPASGTAAITAGMVFTIVNKSGSDQTITQASGVTLRLSGTSTTGNRTLSTYGVATIVCIGTSDFVISGSGLF